LHSFRTALPALCLTLGIAAGFAVGFSLWYSATCIADVLDQQGGPTETEYRTCFAVFFVMV